MTCDPDEFGWCPTHDVPFIDLAGQNVCAQTLGQTVDMIADQQITRMYVKLQTVEQTCTEEHHTDMDCDHSDCYGEQEIDDLVTEAKQQMIEREDVGDLLDLIEQQRLMPADISEWRRRIGAEDSFTQRLM